MRTHSTYQPGRRTFLKGLGTAAGLLLPFVRQLEARAAGKAPLRFLFVYTPNGYDLPTFGADGSETDFKFRPSLTPFDRPDVRPHISLLKGLQLKNNHPDHRGHGSIAAIMTCQTPTGSFPYVSAGPSFDNELARALKVSPLNLGVCMALNAEYKLCWDAAGKASSFVVDPNAARQKLFGSMPGMPPVPMPGNSNRKKVHDLLVREIKEFKKRIPSEDRVGLDLYLEKVEALGGTAMQPPTSETPVCVAPKLDGNVTVNAQKDVVALGDMHMNLIVSAFACGLTRVATLQWGTAVYGPNIGNPNSPWDHHECSHWFADPPEVGDRRACDKGFAEQFVKLIAKLKAVPEGDGTLLDNTLILWGTETSDAHDSDNMTWIMAGGKGSRLRTGRNFELRQASLADVFVSVQNEFGVQSKVFGDPQFCSGGLKNVFAV
jgi:Protein of unknown function (DUF1552)